MSSATFVSGSIATSDRDGVASVRTSRTKSKSPSHQPLLDAWPLVALWSKTMEPIASDGARGRPSWSAANTLEDFDEVAHGPWWPVTDVLS